MPCVAEFGIIHNFHKDKDYGGSYEPKTYDCVAIDDALLDDWWHELAQMRTYFHCYSRPSFGLARWGVTLIPPESLSILHNIVVDSQSVKPAKEINRLAILLQQAMSENKYVIHYGV